MLVSILYFTQYFLLTFNFNAYLRKIMTFLVVRPHHRYCMMDTEVINGSPKSEMQSLWGEQGASKLSS